SSNCRKRRFQIGFPLSDIVTTLSQRGDIAPGDLSQTVRHFLTLDKPFSLVLGGGERIIEVRSNAMPDKGIVATFTEIT
ncbi:PAS-domain containing protein, partial [Rhizobium ruizarguesonis]